MSQILNPGQYFIELEFDRMVDPAVLHRALTSMGFGVVVFDQSLPAVQVGGAYTSSMAVSKLGPSSAMLSASKGGVSVTTTKPPPAPPSGTQGTAAPSKATTAPTPPPKASPSASAALTSARTPMVVQSRYTPKVSTVAVADGGRPAALKPSAIAKGPTIGPGKPYAPSATQTGPAGPASDTPAEPGFPGDIPAADAVQPSGPGPEKGEFVAPSAPASTTETVEEQGDPIGPSEEPSTPLAPVTPAASAQAEVEGYKRKIADLWKRWKEWGSPFAEGPGMAPKVSGEDDDPLRFRILARLDRPIALNDRPGMRWLFVKALSFPFFSDLTLQGQPHALRQGSLYEIRFLSRAKSNPTRESVKEALMAMGLSPVKLLAFKRNMKLPNRPASLTLWYGMAIWDMADSVIVHDDPFFFETVREIKTRQQMGR